MLPTVVNPAQPLKWFSMEGITFGDWLRRERNKRRWSQTRVAREMSDRDPNYKGDPSYISKLENGGIGTPLPDTRKRFHEIFGTSDDDLISLGIVPALDDWGRRVAVTIQVPTSIALGEAHPPTVHVGSEHPDDDDPLTPEEEAVFLNLVFRDYSHMTNAQKRMVVDATRKALGEG